LGKVIPTGWSPGKLIKLLIVTVSSAMPTKLPLNPLELMVACWLTFELLVQSMPVAVTVTLPSIVNVPEIIPAVNLAVDNPANKATAIMFRTIFFLRALFETSGGARLNSSECAEK
jgi:hypothetical protein